MTQLTSIQETTQRVAEAISSALQVETEIVDEELTVVAGTGKYRHRVDQKEEGGDRDSGYLYARVLKTGNPAIVEDARHDPAYDPSVLDGTTEELAEICCPISIHGRVAGLIGLSALNEDQRDLLLSRKNALLEFVGRMAELLASKASEAEAMRQSMITSTQLRTIMESIDEGILAIDREGVITHCNRMAAILIRMDARKVIGKHLTRLWRDSPMLSVLETGKGYEWREESYHTSGHRMHFMTTARPILMAQEIVGVVASFRDIGSVRKLAYEIMAAGHVYHIDDMKGESPQIRQLRRRARQVADGDSTVLITGETGTGKGILAGAIHFSGPRSAGPFITINCGAIPDDLLESELFGYEEGAFSGAKRGGKPGKFELANGGTVFLDEIGDLPLRLQSKLLHVLQEKIVERLGATKSTPVDVRVIASTNKNIERMVVDGEFRNDLYFRLSVIPIHISPLRDRKADIVVLLNHFLQAQRRRSGREIKGVSSEVKALFFHYDWPGNVRELENAVEYMTNIETRQVITIDSLPLRIRTACIGETSAQTSLEEMLEPYERELLQRKLNELGTCKKKKEVLAEMMHVSRATMYRRLQKLGIR